MIYSNKHIRTKKEIFSSKLQNWTPIELRQQFYRLKKEKAYEEMVEIKADCWIDESLGRKICGNKTQTYYATKNPMFNILKNDTRGNKGILLLSSIRKQDKRWINCLPA